MPTDAAAAPDPADHDDVGPDGRSRLGSADDLAGLPMLAQVPELGAALQAARRVDRDVAILIDSLMRLQQLELAERATGVALEQWLAIVARRTHADRRMLLTTCDVLRRLPALRDAFVTHATVSWAQLRSVVLQVCRLPHHLDERIDHELARAIDELHTTDPDVLPRTVAWTLASLDPANGDDDRVAPAVAPFFAMQPRLDGTGGRVWGEFDGHGFAVLDAALNTPASTSSGLDNSGLDGSSSSTTDVLDGDVLDGYAPDDGQPGSGEDVPVDTPDRWGKAGERRARRLIDLLERDHTATTGGDGACVPARPSLLLRLGLDELLGHGRLPAAALTRLTGGRMWIDAATVRRLVEQRGADLRTIVLDDTGAVVGIGRKSRVVPGWLKDATLALHDTCSAPGCQIPARRCDTDHATPWYPTRPDATGGRTDVDNLAPLCAHHNRSKEPDGWHATQRPDGTRRWHHARTGLTTRTVPAPHDLLPASTAPSPASSAHRDQHGVDPVARPPSTSAGPAGSVPGRRRGTSTSIRVRAGPSDADDDLPF